jgi:hypothetical protein
VDFTLIPDQDALMSAIDKLAAQFESKPTDFHGFALVGHDLERELDEGQYFDIALIPELGPLSATMALERLARLPYTRRSLFRCWYVGTSAALRRTAARIR